MSNIKTFENSLPDQGIVLVDFYADWCQPCKMMMPTLQEIANNYNDQVIVGKVDTESQPELATTHGVNSLPTLILFKDGKEIERLIGLKNVDEISAVINDQL